MITMYGTHCPMCNQLEKRLKQFNIEFNMIDDSTKVVEFGKAHNLSTAPILDVDGKIMTYKEAMSWAKAQGENA